MEIIAGIIMSLMMVVVVVTIINYIIGVIACMAVYNKTGHSKIAAFVPIYNMYLVYDALRMRSYFIWSYIISVAVSVISSLAAEIGSPEIISALVSLLVTVLSIYMQYVFSKRLTEAFGFYNVGMIICCIFFPRIVMIICGYRGESFTVPKDELSFKDDILALTYRIFRVNE